MKGKQIYPLVLCIHVCRWNGELHLCKMRAISSTIKHVYEIIMRVLCCSESPRRLDDIQRELKRTLHENEEFCVTTDFGKANYRHLTLVHSEDYIRTVGALNGLIKNVQDEEAAVSVPFTPYIQKNVKGLRKLYFFD